MKYQIAILVGVGIWYAYCDEMEGVDDAIRAAFAKYRGLGNKALFKGAVVNEYDYLKRKTGVSVRSIKMVEMSKIVALAQL